MRGILVRWLVSAVALWLTSGIVRGVQVRGVTALLLAAAMIGVINAVVRPLVLLLTLPLSIVTFGLFILVINASMLALASAFVPGFEVQGFWAAFWGWLLLSFFTFVINVLIGEHGQIEVVQFRY
jgi:putative membrane protein